MSEKIIALQVTHVVSYRDGYDSFPYEVIMDRDGSMHKMMAMCDRDKEIRDQQWPDREVIGRCFLEDGRLSGADSERLRAERPNEWARFRNWASTEYDFIH